MNIGLVRKVVNRIAPQRDPDFDDYIQIGSLGLIKAIERFDPTLGYQFSTFAINCIRGEISHWIRDKSKLIPIPRSLYQAAKDIQKGRAAHLPIELKRKAAIAYWQTNPARLDASVCQPGVPEWRLGELVPDRRSELAAMRQLELSIALDFLNDADRAIIEAIYLNGKQQKEIAAEIGCCDRTLSRRIKFIMARLAAIHQEPIAPPTRYRLSKFRSRRRRSPARTTS